MSRLPGYHYQGSDPDGYMSLGEVIDLISTYAQRATAPVVTHTTVTRVEPSSGGYRVASGRGDWVCRAVVLATGACNEPIVPRFSASVPAGAAVGP